MCGFIAAQLATPWLTSERLVAALATISHRGPDGAAHWFSSDRLTALGHVRLSIIGLNNGDQPIGHARGDLNLVVNGEFYGFKAIRDDLRSKGYRFSTESDSEIALHLYDEYGMDFTQHLRGEFAAVITDRRSGEMIAVRDRFGIKPLFYSVYNGSVLFASEIKALLALGVPTRWDHAAVLADMANIRTNSSMFTDIHQVPPGCVAIAQNGTVQIRRYWAQNYPTAAALRGDTRSEEEVVSQFRAVLDDAVTERLTADVEVACYLSGGLDSSAVLGLAQAKLDRPIRAFTIKFEGDWDESPLAQRTAAFTGSNYVEVPVSPLDMADALEDTIWHGEKPIFNANSAAKFLLSKAVRDAGIKVVFTGEGSDEMLAGYPHERRDNILFGGDHASSPAREASIEALIASNPLTRSLFFPAEPPAPGTRHLYAAIGHCPSWIEGMSRMYVGSTDLMRSDFPGGANLDEPYRRLVEELDLARAADGCDAVNIGLMTWQHTMLVNFILTVLGDRMEMAHSVEGRVPFLDHHVAEFAAQLPIHFKIRETTEKFILREATRDVITSELYARQKHPFMAPPLARTEGVSDPLRQRCEDLIRSREFEDQPFFDPVKTRAFLDDLAAGNMVTDPAISGLLLRIATLSVMQQRFAIAA